MEILSESRYFTKSDWKAVQIETEKVIQHHSKTFFFATGLLPTQKRSAIRSLYAFCRKTDDLVDRKDATLKDLERWRNRVNMERDELSDPTLLLWARVRQQYKIDRRYEKELIDGVAMDLEKCSYKTWAELQTYCYHVASTVGLLSIPIIGTRPGVSFEEAAPYAIQLGIALQLTNILRDVGEDIHHGRVYLPEEDLALFGLVPCNIYNQVYDDRFINLMKFEIERARSLYQESLPGIALLDASVRLSVSAAARLYMEILNEIEAIDYQVYHKRAHTSARKKIMLLPGILRSTL